MKTHKKIHDPSTWEKCPHCEYLAKRKWHLSEHIKHAHTDLSERVFLKCPHCKKELMGSYTYGFKLKLPKIRYDKKAKYN